MNNSASKDRRGSQRADPVLYLGEPEALTGAHELTAGAVEVRSLRAPDKVTSNEDSAVVIPLADGGLVLAVADGVGGARGGREASNTAVTVLRDRLRDSGVAERGLRATILDALEEANAEVMGLNLGAATTLVVAEIYEGELRSYHVGDSEILGVGQRGRIKLQITPHSPTGFAVEAGILDADEALTHAERHIISNVIGAEDMRIEVGTAIPLAVRDTVLLASDGLVDNLRLGEIVDLIRAGPLTAAADALIELAQQRMMGVDLRQPSKPDDLTIMLYRPSQARKNSQGN
jgi:serine/threonine protein phosphatase PrpC